MLKIGRWFGGGERKEKDYGNSMGQSGGYGRSTGQGSSGRDHAIAATAVQTKTPESTRRAPVVSGRKMVAIVTTDRCTACGLCLQACFSDAIQVDSTAVIDQAKCLGCGSCTAECPNEALSLGEPKAGS